MNTIVSKIRLIEKLSANEINKYNLNGKVLKKYLIIIKNVLNKKIRLH